jgi:hypothetical protein
VNKILAIFCILALFILTGINFNENPSSSNGKHSKAIDIALADPTVKEKVEFLERRYGKITPEVTWYDNRCTVRFNLEVDKKKAERTEKELIFFSHKPHGFSCTVNMDTEEVEEILGWHFEEAMLLDIVLANHEARSKIESLRERYENVSIVFTSSDTYIVELRFTPEYNPHKERTEELYGILCAVDMETKKVVKVREFDISSVPVSTPQDPPFRRPELHLYLNDDREERVHEFGQGEEIRISVENTGKEVVALPDPPWKVIVLPMLDAEIEGRLHCSPEESVYAKFPKIYPDMYDITNSLIYEPDVEQTALIHPNETLTWTWDQKLNDGSLLRPGHYKIVLNVNMKVAENTIFYVLGEANE